MNFRYIPNTFRKEAIENTHLSNDEFLKYQVKYRESFEAYLQQLYDFSQIDKMISNFALPIPEVQDREYNFYHKYSTLGSKYIFLRNNVHIERLTKEERLEIERTITKGELLSLAFLNQTCERVLFEEGDFVLVGPTSLENQVPSKSLVFEFAYDQKSCISIEQVVAIKKQIEELTSLVKNSMQRYIRMPIVFHVYKAIPDLYK